MATPLATVAALEARLGTTLTGADLARAEQALSSASARARAAGLPWPNPETVPPVVAEIVLDAAERYVRNPDGYRAEMLASYQYQRPASEPTGLRLSDAEIEELQGFAGLRGIQSVPIAYMGSEI